jgi:hypothetical protein
MQVLWLQEHEHLAKKIAANARNFGKSYLRYEDYLCYISSAIETIGSIENSTDVTHDAFDPEKIKFSEDW